MNPTPASTELIEGGSVRFPDAKLSVIKGPDKGRSVTLRGRTVRVGTDPDCDLVLTDGTVSREHFEISGGPRGFRLRDLGSTNGVLLEGARVMDAWLHQRLRLVAGRTELRFEPSSQQVEWPLSPRARFGELVGQSAAMRRVFAVLERAAEAATPVLLEGESGTGKAACGRTLHAAGPRADRPLVEVAVLPGAESDVDAQLFGDERTQGALLEAAGGTVYLHDVAALPLSTQHRLLRALETGCLPGGQPFDARLIAASDRSLEAASASGAFRPDLLLVLGTVRVHLPSLRERPEDIPALLRGFAGVQGDAEVLPEGAVAMLARHDWPGNVRELRSVFARLRALPGMPVEQLIASAVGASPGKEGTSPGKEGTAAPATAEEQEALVKLTYHEAKERVLQQFEQVYFSAHMKKARGSVGRAAQRMGLPRQSLYRMLRRWGMSTDEE